MADLNLKNARKEKRICDVIFDTFLSKTVIISAFKSSDVPNKLSITQKDRFETQRIKINP